MGTAKRTGFTQGMQLKQKLVVGSALALTLAFIGIEIVQAYLTSSGPSASSFGYVVSKTTDVNISSTSVGLYFDTNTSHTVTIANGHLCDFGTDSAPSNQMGDLATAALGVDFNSFVLYRTDASESATTAITSANGEIRRRYWDTSGCATDDITLTIPSSALVRSDLTGKYVAILRATVLGTAPANNQNTFRVSSSGALVGVIGANDSLWSDAKGSQAGYNYNPAGTIPRKRGNQDIFFGTPCSIASNTTAYIHMYDIDNNDGNIQQGQITVDVYDLTTGTLAASTNVYGFQYVSPNVWAPVTGSSIYATLRFTAQPNHKYRLDVNNQDNYNTIQLTLPFNSIYADINCANVQPTIDPSVSITPNTIVVAGEPATVNFGVNVTKNDAAVNYVRYTWIDRDGNNTYDSGTDLLVTQVGPADNTFPVGTYNYPSAVTGAQTASGLRVCGSFSMTARTSAYGLSYVVPSVPEVACVPIGKFPKMQVKNGDVWVGGGISGACTTSAGQDFIYGAPNNGSQDASFGNLGVTALGNITQFGSSGVGGLRGLNDPPTAETLTFAATPALDGSFYGSLPQSKCLTDPRDLYGLATTPGSAVIGAQSLGAGAAYTRHYSGDIRITGNVTYQPGPYAYGTFPTAVVIADGNIIIDPSVTTLDGVYIAGGNIYTCGNTGQSTNVVRNGNCDTKLEVRGSLFAGGRLVPWRAGGAIAPNQLDKAETIDLRPNTYYSECQRVCNSGMRTVTQQEAPIRF